MLLHRSSRKRLALTAAVFSSMWILVTWSSLSPSIKPTWSGQKLAWRENLRNGEASESKGKGTDHGILSSVRTRLSLNSTHEKWAWGEDKYYTNEWCEKKRYDVTALPRASVIICFHETESLEDLLHTLHILVQNSPQPLLQEIILINDNSRRDLHVAYLRNYVAGVFGSLVRLVHHEGPESLGISRCRTLGVRQASGQVVVVLDAHLEVREGWLEPLLHEIAQDRRTLASVTLDWLEPQEDGSWVYNHGPNDALIAWSWRSFTFLLWVQKTAGNSKRLETDPTQPYRSPSTVGNWAMDREFFWEIGGMDEGMMLWGAENIDISIRTYLWGGRVVMVPCSHTAHLERMGQRTYRQDWTDATLRNYKRIAEVWLDEYRDTFYRYNPEIKAVDAGDLTERFALKARCPNRIQTYFDQGHPFLGNPLNNTLALGKVHCGATNKSSMYWETPWSYGMSEDVAWWLKEVYLTTEGLLRLDLAIFSGREKKDGEREFFAHTVYMDPESPDVHWMHKRGGLIKASEFDACLECPVNGTQITLAACDASSPLQQWTFASYTHLYDDLVTGKSLESTDFRKKYSQFLQTYP